MPVNDRQLANAAFSSPEWQAAADSLFQATGVTVSVMDFEAQELRAGGSRCGHCHLVTDMEEPGPTTCFDTCPDPASGSCRVVCRAGLPTLISPVVNDGRTIAHVVLGGFVTSTRDRRRLFEQMLAKSTREDSVRMAMKSLVVIPRRQAEGYLEMALACARTVVDATQQRLAAAERVEELRLFVSAGQQVVATEKLDAPTLGGIAEEAVTIVGGEAGAVLRQCGDMLQVIARTERWRGPIGALVASEATASGRAASTGRTVVSRSGEGATLALPLTIGSRVLGVLEVRLPASAVPVSQERVARLDRFGRFIAIALERDDERIRAERAMSGYTQLNGLAATLGGKTDLDGVTSLIMSTVDRAFAYQISGLVLSSWGRDQADVAIRGDVTRDELGHVLAEVAGRDVRRDPFDRVRTVTHRGALIEGGVERTDWATAVVELEHGDLVVGYLFVASADGTRYNAQDRALLEGIAAHAGAAFGRAALFTRIRDDYAKTIAALSATLDAGEHMPSGHSSRVMEYAMLIGEELELGFEEVEKLRFAGLLHDIGKTGLPSELLLKPSKLTEEELEKVKAHAELGATIVDQIEFLKSLAPVILHHHEHWDGSGYPVGLSGDAIPLLARVLAVADTFDAMTSKTPYRKAMSFAAARRELDLGAGSKFDPLVVSALLGALDRQALAGGTGLFAPRAAKGRPELPS